ncbi:MULTISPECIES: pyridoxal-dependent decarboxylase [Streptomyces]|uniref:pyridoxal-dependent decarboxylase n=1 Tax=Streptomyces TaxID=1883 RepID=UPI00163CC0DE|nr:MULTISPECIES: pyridoxal-dependent decarboxylase [Streptomyces]MBC2876462.1 ATP-grasp domain-containing protein [Streptomyces sp. TYQ1024]UBI40864.1 ATP-grasp domain-containing protein [Streptomyces mobaraensis]
MHQRLNGRAGDGGPATEHTGDIEGIDADTGRELLDGLLDEAVWLDHCAFVSASFGPAPAWLRHEPVSAFRPLPVPPPASASLRGTPGRRRVCVSFAPEHGPNARTWARTHGYRLLAPDAGVTAWAADKISVLELFGEAGVATPPCVVVPATGRAPARAYWHDDWPGAVAQRRENNLIGRGTAPLASPADLDRRLAGWPDEPVRLSRRAPGISLTVTACAGPDRTVVSAVSHQLVGLPELAASWGTHCGNQLVHPGDLPDGLYGQAREAARRVGEVLRGRGFRGVFGLDLVEEDGRLLAVEVNPRFQTVVSLVQAAERAAGLLPTLGLHILSFLLPALPPSVPGTLPSEPCRPSQLVVHAAEDTTLHGLAPTGRYRRAGRVVTGPLAAPADLTELHDDEALYWAVARPGPVAAGQELALLQFRHPVAPLEPRPRLHPEAREWISSFHGLSWTEEEEEKEEATTPLLRLPEGPMRTAGLHALDLIIERFTTSRARPPLCVPSPDELRAVLDEPLPESGTDDLCALLERVTRDALGQATRLDHPRSFVFTPATGNFPAVLADALASAYLSVPGAWLVGAGPTQLELTTLDWLKALLGLPEEAGGLFVSGGSVANLTALAVARDHHLSDDRSRARLYCSTQAHPSVARAAHLLGLTRGHLSVVPADRALRLDPAEVARRVTGDRGAGLRPFAVVATLGTTGTGAVDPLDDLADLCEREGLWLHVDGAHGAAAAATARGHGLRTGLRRADSLTVDPHKWLFQPYEIGCVLLRRPELLRATFDLARHTLDSGYLAPTFPRGDEVNLSDHGPQQSRGLRALKLWLSLKTFGAGAFRQAIEHGMDLAEHAAALITDRPELTLVTPASLAVLTFRYHPADAPPGWDADAAQEDISRAVCAEGEALLLTTRVHGATVLRMCTVNPGSTRDDVAYVLHQVVRHGRRSVAAFRESTGALAESSGVLRESPASKDR